MSLRQEMKNRKTPMIQESIKPNRSDYLKDKISRNKTKLKKEQYELSLLIGKIEATKEAARVIDMKMATLEQKILDDTEELRNDN